MKPKYIKAWAIKKPLVEPNNGIPLVGAVTPTYRPDLSDSTVLAISTNLPALKRLKAAADKHNGYKTQLIPILISFPTPKKPKKQAYGK